MNSRSNAHGTARSQNRSGSGRMIWPVEPAFRWRRNSRKVANIKMTNAQTDAGIALANAAVIISAQESKIFKRGEMRAERRLQKMPHVFVPQRGRIPEKRWQQFVERRH